MAIRRLFPYTNFHDLNLDVIIERVNEAEAAAAASAADVAAAAADMAAADAKATLALSTANSASTAAGNAATAAGNAQTTADAAKDEADDLNAEKPIVVLRINSTWDSVQVIEVPNLSHVTGGILRRLKQGRLIFEVNDPSNQIIGYYRILPHITMQTSTQASVALEMFKFIDTPPTLTLAHFVVIFATVTESSVTIDNVVPVVMS